MSSRLVALTFPAADPASLAAFWSGVLGWDASAAPEAGVTLLPADDTGFRIRFVPSEEPKPGPNQMHFDLTSTSFEDQQATVDRALALGAGHLDVGQLPEEGHVVLADPEGIPSIVRGGLGDTPPDRPAGPSQSVRTTCVPHVRSAGLSPPPWWGWSTGGVLDGSGCLRANVPGTAARCPTVGIVLGDHAVMPPLGKRARICNEHMWCELGTCRVQAVSARRDGIVPPTRGPP